jgi:hypothetical protein
VKPVYLRGLALWSPGYRDLGAFARGERDESVVDCESPWVPPRLLRGASRLTRMLGEAAARATAHAGADPKTIATVYASAYGEIETMVILLETIFAGDGQLSPMRFKNSVHNAAAGLGSIGTANQGFSTALAAGDRSFEAAMIEAIVLLGERGGDAVVSVADDRLPEPLSRECAREGLAVGLCLGTSPEGAIAMIGALRQDREAIEWPKAFLDRPLDPALATNPAAAALPLVEAATRKRAARVPLAFGCARPYSVSLAPAEREAV